MEIVGQGETSRWEWGEKWQDVDVRFFGRPQRAAEPPSRDLQWLSRCVPPGHEISRARQVHSAVVLEGCPGEAGEGDALISRRSDLVLTVVTADCVPVLLASTTQLAAVHAGWRGIVGGILTATMQRLEKDEPVAWIGPAIGRCCYEVGEEVAEQVVAVSDASVVAWRRPRPHVDLVAAASHQLRAAGVRQLRVLPQCTRCEDASLWSYRRQGSEAGRNVAAIWRRPGFS